MKPAFALKFIKSNLDERDRLLSVDCRQYDADRVAHDGDRVKVEHDPLGDIRKPLTTVSRGSDSVRLSDVEAIFVRDVLLELYPKE